MKNRGHLRVSIAGFDFLYRLLASSVVCQWSNRVIVDKAFLLFPGRLVVTTLIRLIMLHYTVSQSHDYGDSQMGRVLVSSLL